MDQPLIAVSNLVQSYDGQPVLDIENLRINQGDVLALLGRNGSGKSTLLRMLSLLEKPASGEILFHGRRLASEKERFEQRRRMAMVFQEPLLFSGTVAYNVSYAPAVRGLPHDVIAERCERAFSLLGIEHLASR
ncbi:MAG: ATP-binding cassette domain-containing protein, partial [Bacillota bacterium]